MNINNNKQTQDERAIQSLKQHLTITKEMQKNGRSSTVGIYIVYSDEKVMEKWIPDHFIGV